ncbi:hypothetical protein J437_LFUL015390 [Ladona fulva]|uniref:Nuclear pore complex protein Nup153 n=1 Tax=Ladona fulva TaxID=123851 RepID=A0A8K0P4G5_LADFU|nr:hypothetical protein J437_LFUL015390 [Ladona fulva]
MNNSTLLPSLESFTSPGRTVPVGRRRNPSFNPDIFGPQNWSGEKTNIKDRIVNSPFYSGRTTYGGISAYQNHLGRSSNQQEASGLRSIRVHPVKTSEAKGDAAVGMSNTARRILEALEMFSSPIQDAKKIPLTGSMNIKRRKILSNMDKSQLSANSPSTSAMSLGASNSLADFTPTVKELIVPTVPDILALRRRQRLQGSTVAAREVANETNVLPFSTEKVSDNVGYWTSEKSGGGKIRSKKEIDEETVEKPNLPNVSLPITSLPKFDFILSADLPSQSLKQTNSSKFKFSSPIAVTSVSESLVTSNKFTFSSPQKATERDNSRSIGPRTDMLRTVESVHKKSENVEKDVATDKIASKKLETERLVKRGLESSSKFNSSHKDVLSQNVAQRGQINSNVLLGSKEFSGKNALKEDSKFITNSSKSVKGVTQKNSQVSLSLGSEACKNVNEKVDSSKVTNIETKSGFGNRFKPPSGSWSCDVCMISNPSDKSKCVACETPRSGFGDQFKPPSGSWSCDVCMISNPSDKSKCLACETPRKSSETGAVPVSGETKSTSSGFGGQFKKPDGAWDCTICLVRNKAGGPPKCVACEAPKPGSESVAVKSESSSSNKLSLGSSVNSGFQFGIDKAGNLPNTSSDTKPSFSFGSSASTAAFGGSSLSSGFTFGIKPEEGTKASGFTFGIATTKESSEVDGPKNPMVSQSSSLFGSSENQMNKSSTAEFAKLPQPLGKVEVTEKSETKALKAEDNKFGGFNNASASADDKVPFKTSTDEKVKLNTPTVVSSEKEVKPAFSFVSPEGKPNGNNLSKDSSLSNGKWKVETKPSNNVVASGSAIFGTTTTVAGWNFTLPTSSSQSSPFSSPKASFFPVAAASAATVTADSVKKQEETTKPSAPEFKFGDSSKFEFTIPAAKGKSQEVPTTLSSGFKFQELPKPSSPFSLDDKLKTTSSITNSIASSPISSNTFKSAAPAESVSEKNLVSSEKPSTLPAPSFSDSSAASKSINSGPVFMFGSETGSTGTAFNLAGQKPLAQAAKDDPPKLFGASSGGFNLGKPPTFGSVSSSPSLVTGATLPASETRPATGSLFVTPSSNPVFGSSATTSITTSSSSTTTAVTSAPSAFGSSIFNQPFPAVTAPSGSFGSPSAGSSAFGAPSSVFGSNTTPSSTPFSFSGSAKPAAEEQPTQPAPFVFGSNSNQSTQPFTFGASANKPAFSFAASTQPVAGTSGQAPALPSAPALGGFSFGDASKASSPFGSVQPATGVGGGTSNPFGTSAPNPPSFGAPPLGETNPAVTAAFGTPPFNFGSAQSNPTFSFGANQSASLQPNLSQPSGFNFGQVSQTSSAPQAVAPQFNPNLPPSFNFTNGATPQFMATPGGVSVQPSANTMQRRFKKAVRRTTQPR